MFRKYIIFEARVKKTFFVAFFSFSLNSVHAQIDFSVLNQYRNNQRPADWNSRGSSASPSSSPAQIADQQRKAAATAANEQGLTAYNNNDWAAAAADFQRALEKSPQNVVMLGNLAAAQNSEALDAYNRGDYKSALVLFQQAVANDPSTDTHNSTIRDNLAAAQSRIEAANREQQQIQKDKVTAINMQRDIQAFAQGLKDAPASSELNFDLGNPAIGPSNNSRPAELDFIADPSSAKPSVVTDSMVVDSRVPSGLPKAVDDAIATAYPSTADRVRKGFQAIMRQDWKVADAWLRDAVNHDPGNPGLRRMAALVEYKEQNSSRLNDAEETKELTKAIFENVNGVDDLILSKITADAFAPSKPAVSTSPSDQFSRAEEAKFDDLMLKKIQDDAVDGLKSSGQVHN